jgi:hypothetical protein
MAGRVRGALPAQLPASLTRVFMAGQPVAFPAQQVASSIQAQGRASQVRRVFLAQQQPPALPTPSLIGVIQPPQLLQQPPFLTQAHGTMAGQATIPPQPLLLTQALPSTFTQTAQPQQRPAHLTSAGPSNSAEPLTSLQRRMQRIQRVRQMEATEEERRARRDTDGSREEEWQAWLLQQNRQL